MATPHDPDADLPDPVRVEFEVRARVGDDEWATLGTGWAWGRTARVVHEQSASALRNLADVIERSRSGDG